MSTHFFRKRLTALLLPFVTVVCNAYDFYSGDLYFNILSEEDKTVEIVYNSMYRYLQSRIVIPSIVKNEGTSYSVIRIRNYAFHDCESLTSIVIPEGVTSIGEEAFFSCDNLKTVTLPSTLTEIGADIFRQCYSLEGVAYYSSEPPVYSTWGIYGSVTLYIPEGSKDTYRNRGYLSHFSSVKDILSDEMPALFMLDYLLYGYDDDDRSVNYTSDNIMELLGWAYYLRRDDDWFWNNWAEWEQTYAALQAYYMTEATRSEVDDLTQRIEKDTLLLVEQMQMLEDDYRSLGSLREEWEKCTEEYKELAAKYQDLKEQLDSLYNLTSPTWEDYDLMAINEERLVWTDMLIAETEQMMVLYTSEFQMLREKYQYPDAMEHEMEDLENRIDSYGYELESLAERLRAECSPQVVDDIQYQLMADTTATVVGYDGDDTHVVIRDSIAFDGLMFPVKKIGQAAFKGLDITSVDIPETVEEIGEEAFADCFLLVTIICRHQTVPPSVLANAFRNCGIYVGGGGSGSGGGSGCSLYVYGSVANVFRNTGSWNNTFKIIWHWEYAFTGYATVYTSIADLQIPSGIKAYTGIIDGDRVKLTEISDKIPVGTPVIIYGKDGTYKFDFTTGAEPVGENDLKGTDEPLVADGTQYILGEKQNYGFFKAKPGSTIPAGKVYIETTAQNVKGFYFYEDDATDLNLTPDFSLKDDVLYNLAGQRINKILHGLNIVNGKKILK